MKHDEIAKIGSDLVADSKARERTPGEVLQELFPYVLEASRRMSAREISRWLQEKHGVQISQPTISRALRSGAGWEAFDEIIYPVARRVSSSLGISMKELLLDDSVQASCDLQRATEDAKQTLGMDEFQEVEEGLDFLTKNWFALSAGTRRACAPAYISEEEGEPNER